MMAPIRFSGQRGGVRMEVAIEYGDSFAPARIESSFDGVATPEGGAHVLGFWRGLREAVVRRAEAAGQFDETMEPTQADVGEGLRATIHVTVAAPDTRVNGIVFSFVREKLTEYFERDLWDANRIIRKVNEAARARRAAEAAAQLAQRRPDRGPIAHLGLAETQALVQDFIVAAKVGEDHAAVEQIQPSGRMTAAERLGVYRDMYPVRMREALEADYPGLRHYLGAEKFQAMTEAYVAAHPSRSYTLNRLGDKLPEFLKDPFERDLAGLEQVLTEAFDAPETEVLTAERLREVPPEAFEEARLEMVASVRVREYEYRVSEYLGAVEGENPFPTPRKRRNYVVAWRSNFRVRRMALKRAEFELLINLICRTPLLGAASRAHVSPGRLFELFRDWTAAGLFQSIGFKR